MILYIFVAGILFGREEGVTLYWPGDFCIYKLVHALGAASWCPLVNERLLGILVLKSSD